MSMTIHPLSVIGEKARLGEDVVVGPFCVIEDDVTIGDGCVLESHVVVKRGTLLGKNCRLCPGVVLGHVPQDLKFKGEGSYLVIGDNNTFREYSSLHRATPEPRKASTPSEPEAMYAGTGVKRLLAELPGAKTIVGDGNLFMAYSHAGHNCRIGSHVMISNSVGVSGHVVIEDRAIIGGMVGIHQFVRVGKLAMVGGYSKVVQDVPPFMMADGRPSEIVGVNVRGLVRSGVAAPVRENLKKAYKTIYRGGLNLSQAIERIEAEIEPSAELDYLLEFVRRIREGRMGRQEEKR